MSASAPLWARVALATAIGALAGAASWLLSRGGCPTGEQLDVGMRSCEELVASMAVRIGIVVAVVALLIDLTSAGLQRTAQRMHEQRREAEVD